MFIIDSVMYSRRKKMIHAVLKGTTSGDLSLGPLISVQTSAEKPVLHSVYAVAQDGEAFFRFTTYAPIIMEKMRGEILA